MEFFWIILGWLFPADPVRQCTMALRQQVAQLAASVLREECLIALDDDPAYRMELEAAIIDLEASLQLVIGSRACQIAGLPVVTCDRSFHPPTRARSTLELLARLADLATALDRIEHLAQLRAAKLRREHDADPLSLRALSSLAEGGGGGSRALARETEGAGRNAAGCARGPPPTIV